MMMIIYSKKIEGKWLDGAELKPLYSFRYTCKLYFLYYVSSFVGFDMVGYVLFSFDLIL